MEIICVFFSNLSQSQLINNFFQNRLVKTNQIFIGESNETQYQWHENWKSRSGIALVSPLERRVVPQQINSIRPAESIKIHAIEIKPRNLAWTHMKEAL